MKDVVFIGSSLDDLRAMPVEVQDAFGYAIHLAQAGETHPDAKSFVHGSDRLMEVVARFDGDAFRAFYSIKIGALVYVLHCMQKKSPRQSETPKPALEALTARVAAAKAAAKTAALREAARAASKGTTP